MPMTPAEEANYLPIRAALDEWMVGQHPIEDVTGQYLFSKTQRGMWNFDDDDTIKLRLDWELDAEDRVGLTSDQLFSLMSLQMAQDLTDLATNGKRPPVPTGEPGEVLPPYTHDPLLSLLDGTVVHGKTLESLVLHETYTYEEFKIGKNAYEFTVFVAVTFNFQQ